jgi:hypothetical protein
VNPGRAERWSTLVALLAVGAFLLALPLHGTAPGFPLDDAWIHQTYARNLAQRGEFAFVPGRPSAGSTAPLWTLLLVPGYWLGLMPYVGTWALGALTLIGTAVAAAALARALFPEDRLAPTLAALVVAGEWHMVWCAVSGMETGLFAAGVLALLALAVRWGAHPPTLTRAFLGGLGVGALALVRPEGVLLLGVLGLSALLARARWRFLLPRWIALGAGAALVLAPYALLNLRLSGTLFPNTFYAKQQEYAALYALPLATRLLRLWPTLLVGPLAVLLPAVPWALPPLTFSGAGPRPHRRLHAWLPLAWSLGTWVLYAWRLPVTYQHGRYLMPILPPLLVYGVYGVRRLWRRGTGGGPRWIVSRAWAGAALVLAVSTLWIGATTFATDVAIINGEMVEVARWLNANTPPDALIASHDIGAVGYFARRPLLDLAGLITPEVIPFLRDEARLLAWMEAQGADYLVTFPSWYPHIVADPRLDLRYQTDTALTREMGQDNFAVYACQWTASSKVSPR